MFKEFIQIIGLIFENVLIVYHPYAEDQWVMMAPLKSSGHLQFNSMQWWSLQWDPPESKPLLIATNQILGIKSKHREIKVKSALHFMCTLEIYDEMKESPPICPYIFKIFLIKFKFYLF